MAESDLEPFPAVSSGAQTSMQSPTLRQNGDPKPRRKSSSLGGEPRGDTGAAAFATMATPSTSLLRQPSDKTLRPNSKRRKARSLLRRFLRLSLKHTWLIPLILMSIGLALYAVNPTESNPMHSCIFLSYPLPRDPVAAPDAPIQYAKGKADFAFVGFYMIVLSFTREFLMQRLIRPIAIRCGVTRRAKQARFMEQFYTAIYFSILGPLGLYVMYRSPVWYFNTTGMFEGFPHRTHEGIFKFYYLLQASYWAQQGLVLVMLLEKPRKDFKELVLHHVVTLALIWLSYRFHFTYMGVAVYVTHDISDFFLATSKILNYVDSPITTPYFAFFAGVWIYTRHYICLRIIYATLTEFATVGPFELNWETQQYKCWISQIVACALLSALQAVNLFWLFLIFRIAWRFLSDKELADERSDEEAEDAEDEVREKALESRDRETPAVLVNGSAIKDEDLSTPLEQKNGAVRRSPRRKG